MRYGCQTYCWEMNAARYRGHVSHMLSVAAEAGFEGFEPDLKMLGDGWTPASLADDLERHGLNLAAMCLAEHWQDDGESPEEVERADKAIEAVRHWPGAVLNLVQYPGSDRSHLGPRRERLMRCLASIAERATDHGVSSAFHPNSPHGSLYRTPTDYEELLERLPESIGFTPDTGHLVRGGMDPLEILRRHRRRVVHLHLKDVGADGLWSATGAGVVDFVGIARYLRESGYSGWLVMEDESAQAEADPDQSVRNNWTYAERHLLGERA